jgi:hypothetical protein
LLQHAPTIKTGAFEKYPVHHHLKRGGAMTEEPKIQHIDSITAQREEGHIERLPGDLVCGLTDPERALAA